MAKFKQAYDLTMGHEGGYVNDKNDAGGETYKGISRKYNPSWNGWEVIDDGKSSAAFPQQLNSNYQLQANVESFYKANYWDVNRLDEVSSQAIANEMFDSGVNMGVARSAQFLQQSLNYLNRNDSVFSDLVVDGKIGPASLSALEKVLVSGDEEIVLIMMNVLQGNHYMEYMSKSPTQEKYARGWFKRVRLCK